MNFNSIANQAVERSMDAMWMKMRIHSDNIANYETPGYKAKELDFRQILKSAQGGEAEKLVFRTTVTTNDNTSARMDGNNVVMEKEQLELWKAEAQYAFLSQKVSGTYRNINTIVTQLGR